MGDNVDMRTDPRQMTSKRQRQDYHLFNEIAYLNHVGATEYEDGGPVKDIRSTDFREFIPNEELVSFYLVNYKYLHYQLLKSFLSVWIFLYI